MSEPKNLPENIAQYEALAAFKAVFSKFTVSQLEGKLRTAGVPFLSADNKADLVWRLMDAQNFDFEAAMSQADNVDTVETTSEGDSNEAVQNEDTQAVTSQHSGDNADDVPATTTVDSKTDANEGQESASNSEQPNENANANSNDAPPVNSGQYIHQNGRSKQFAAMAAKKSTGNEQGSASADEKDAEHVAVRHAGNFDILEPASVTLIKAGEITKIYTTPTVDKAKITRNIEQLIVTRGTILQIVNK